MKALLKPPRGKRAELSLGPWTQRSRALLSVRLQICVSVCVCVCLCICATVTLLVVTWTVSQVTVGVQCFYQTSVAKHKSRKTVTSAPLHQHLGLCHRLTLLLLLIHIVVAAEVKAWPLMFCFVFLAKLHTSPITWVNVWAWPHQKCFSRPYGSTTITRW